MGVWTATTFEDLYNMACWVKAGDDQNLVRIIPDFGLDNIVFGWIVDTDYFQNVIVPNDVMEIKFADWDPDIEGNEVMLTTWNGDITFWHNTGTAFVPVWEAMNNPFAEVIVPDPPYSCDIGNIDNDDLSDVVFAYDNFLYHYEWNGNTWIQEDTLIVFSERIPMGIQCKDLDNDGDSDFLLKSDRPCQWWSYDVIENQSSTSEVNFGEPQQLPTWLNDQVAVDMTGDGIVEILHAYGYSSKTSETSFDWGEHLWFCMDDVEFFGDIDEYDHMQFGKRINYYETPGTHTVFVSGRINESGFVTTDWAGDIPLNNDPEAYQHCRGMYYEDLDDDDDKDLVYLVSEGELIVLKNEGSNSQPVWVNDSSIFPFDSPAEATLFILQDLNRDNAKDIILRVGEFYNVYQGERNSATPEWNRNVGWEQRLPEIGYQPFGLGDVDNDHDAEILIFSNEECSFYNNIGVEESPYWIFVPDALPVSERVWCWPVFYDFDGDGRDDIALSNKVFLSRNNVGVKSEDILPLSFDVNVNPNPFNAYTTIKLDLPVNGILKVKVFDLLGREVQTLYSGKSIAGIKELSFNSGDVPSGSYWLKVESPSGTISKRIVVLK